MLAHRFAFGVHSETIDKLQIVGIPLENASAVAVVPRAIGRRRSPPPLWGRTKDGGRARLRKLFIDALRGERSATPHPFPPPQGGGERAEPSESSLRPTALRSYPTDEFCYPPFEHSEDIEDQRLALRPLAQVPTRLTHPDPSSPGLTDGCPARNVLESAHGIDSTRSSKGCESTGLGKGSTPCGIRIAYFVGVLSAFRGRRLPAR